MKELIQQIELSEKQVLEKYGNVEVEFSHYYNFVFLYVGNFEDKEIAIEVGGDSEDISRFQVQARRKYLIKELPFNLFLLQKEEKTIEYFLKDK